MNARYALPEDGRTNQVLTQLSADQLTRPEIQLRAF